jgi:hypothetical protein
VNATVLDYRRAEAMTKPVNRLPDSLMVKLGRYFDCDRCVVLRHGTEGPPHTQPNGTLCLETKET